MTLGLVGRKVGMTRVFDEQGVSVPVTVLDMSANRVTQVKSKDADGYTAVQVTFGQKKANRVNKTEAGHFAKAGVEAGRGLVEFALTEEKLAELKAGDEITVSMFEVGQLVDVPVPLKVRVSLVRSNVITSVLNVLPTVTPVPTVFLVLSVWHKTLVACSLVNAWQVNTVTLKQLFKNWKLYVLMLNANSCWLKVLFRVRLTATSWFVLA